MTAPRYADPIPELEELLAEAASPPALREGDIARIATLTCDEHHIPDLPLATRLVRLAWAGSRRQASLPPISQGEIVDLCVFACDAWGVPRADDLSWRLGVLAGLARVRS